VIGERALRREDPRLLTGRGRFLADHDRPGLCHVAILRSPLAHARVLGVDASAARALPGVVAVVVQGDLEEAGARPMQHLLPIPGVQPLAWGVLAADRVRFVGEPVAAVVAGSRAVAEDACELIEVDFDELAPVVGMDAAMAPGAPLLYPEWGTNEFLHLESSTPGFEAAMEAARHRLTERFEHHRVTAVPLEGHGAQAAVDPSTGVLTVIASTQQPHQLRTVIAEVCGRAESDVRVVSPDMGGGFGNKQHFTREECLVALLACLTGRPVRWVQDRTEGLTASIHSRPQVHDITVGYDDDGRILAMRVGVGADIGDPVLYFSGVGPTLVTVGALGGGYAIGEQAWSLSCVATTTCPVGAYRGFGQPQAHFTAERVMDLVAADLGLDPADVRRRNLLPDHPRPWTSHDGARIDVGSLGPQLDQLLDEFGYRAWRRRQQAMREAGRLVGIGLSTLVQGTAPTQFGVAGRFGSWEVAAVSVLPDGRVTVTVGTKSQGQGHETVLAQVAAGILGVAAERVAVVDGDTAAIPGGMGSWGSRTAVMGGGAVLRAAEVVRDKMARIAAAMGGAPGFDEVAAEAWWYSHRLPAGMEPGLTATVCYTPGNTIPVPDEHGHINFDETFGSHMSAAAVEVDPATGTVAVLDLVLVSDCGVVINPTVVEGQHQGGFAQGLGAVLLEEVRYSPEGQPLTSTLLDYTIPEAPDVPVLRVVHRQTPSATAGGFRGVGEAAIIAAPALLGGAVDDALRPLGVRITSTRLHAHVLRGLVRRGGYAPDAAAFARA
jgi:carbon-monoxide dehydrogenase large subunit